MQNGHKSLDQIINTPDRSDYMLLSNTLGDKYIALPTGMPKEAHIMSAFERAIDRGWMKLVDLINNPDGSAFRIFWITPSGRERIGGLKLLFPEGL